MARLDRLASVKDIAQIAAVIGREFTHELILAVAGLEDSVLTEGLEKLAEAGLVMRRGTPPLAAYHFKHALIQDISYSSLLKSRRQQLHARICTVLVERFAELIETQPELAAHHFSQAGLIAEAVDYWHRAAKLASSRAAPEEAYNHLGFALDGLKQLPETDESRHLRLDLLGQRVTPIIATRSYASPEMKELIDDAMSLYAVLDDASQQIFPILYARWVTALTGGRAIDAPGISAEFLAEAERQNDELKIILGNRISGCARVMVGQPGRGMDFLERALALMEEHAGSVGGVVVALRLPIRIVAPIYNCRFRHGWYSLACSSHAPNARSPYQSPRRSVRIVDGRPRSRSFASSRRSACC